MENINKDQGPARNLIDNPVSMETRGRLDWTIPGAGIFRGLDSSPAREIAPLLHGFDATLLGLATGLFPPDPLRGLRRKAAITATALHSLIPLLGEPVAFFLQGLEADVALAPFNVQIHAVDEVADVGPQVLHQHRPGKLDKRRIRNAVFASLYVIRSRRFDEAVRGRRQDKPEVVALEADAGERMPQRTRHGIGRSDHFIFAIAVLLRSEEKLAGCLELVVGDTEIPFLPGSQRMELRTFAW